jgi:hypothetical protein
MTANDHLDRLDAMTDDDQETWDLSSNDVAALRWAAGTLAIYRAALKSIAAETGTPYGREAQAALDAGGLK